MLNVTDRGNVVYEPDGVVLTDFFWFEGSFCCIQGPIESGTSTASCQKIWRLACQQEPDAFGVRRTKWIVTRRTYKELRQTTVSTWLSWFPEDKWGQFIRAEPMVHDLRQKTTAGWELRDHPSMDGTKVDCQVIFMALDNAEEAEEKLASQEITGFFMNEGQFTEKGVVTELLSRCHRFPAKKDGGCTWSGGWMDMNAPREGHWVPYMRGDIPLPPEMEPEEKEAFVKPKDWTFFVQPPGLIETMVDGKPVYSENPLAENQKWIQEPYMEKIRGQTRRWINQRVLNKVGLYMAGKAVYPTFSETDHINLEDTHPVQGVPMIVGLDFGRDPAAVFMQEVSGVWTVFSEVIGDTMSAQKFAPIVKRHAAKNYAGFAFEWWGDPRGGDGQQATEETAFDVFRKYGMVVLPATTDNNIELRRSTVEAVLDRRNGFKVNPKAMVLRRALAGGHHYRAIKGAPGMFSPKPVKGPYSHPVDALENGLIGGGEGYAVVTNPARKRLKPSSPLARRVRLRRASR